MNFRFLGLLCALLLAGHAAATEKNTLADIDQLLAAGRFGEAAALCETKLTAPDSADDPRRFEYLSRLALAAQNLGAYLTAPDLLEDALELAETAPAERYATLLTQTADAWLATGNSADALQRAYEALKTAETSGDSAALHNARLGLANVLAFAGYIDKALAFYDQTAREAPPALAARAVVNRLRLMLIFKKKPDLAPVLSRARQVFAQMAAGRDKTDVLLSLGESLTEALRESRLGRIAAIPAAYKPQTYALAFEILQEAATEARQRGDKRSLSLAYGGLANLYEKRGRLAEARSLNRQALFYIRQVNHPEVQYLWEWQQARLLRAGGAVSEAIDAFKTALQTLTPEVRARLSNGYRLSLFTFDSHLRPVYYGLANLHLQQADAAGGDARQTHLRAALDAVDAMKVAELENYFHSECVTPVTARRTEPDQLPTGTALVYPIPIPGRVEVVLGVDGALYQFPSLPVTVRKFKDTVLAFRQALQTRSDSSFLSHARDLYDWLIRPLLPLLRQHHIDTLLFVPDGTLRQVPLSALHDGEMFLIEEFAVAITPSLAFLDPHPLDWHTNKMLLVGLSHAVQGYPPLPGVVNELKTIHGLAGKDAHKIFNQAYTTEALEGTLNIGGHTLLHMATHGEFDADPDYTYVLSYEEKIHMDKLSQVIGLGNYRDKPLELLVLSACKTAVGDDRAALGLAGVAVKAGARSAIASLWFVDDESTMLTMQGFYDLMFNTPGMTKAKALQKVQNSLIQQQRYWHPGYWAPFLLIGNWL